MPFRERAKNLFKTKSRSDSDSLSKTSTKNSSLSSRERWPSNVYKPGEPMPRPKYRAIPKREHTEKLQAFSFGDSWRKKSFQSQYSPMGTRAPSRRNSSSRVPSRRNSIFSSGRLSMSETGRTNSMTSAEIEPATAAKSKDNKNAAKPPRLSTEVEEDSDGDVTNVGVSKQGVQKPQPSSGLLADDRARGLPSRPMNTAHDHQPFTEHDLTLALHRSHLAVPTSS